MVRNSADVMWTLNSARVPCHCECVFGDLYRGKPEVLALMLISFGNFCRSFLLSFCFSFFLIYNLTSSLLDESYTILGFSQVFVKCFIYERHDINVV